MWPPSWFQSVNGALAEGGSQELAQRLAELVKRCGACSPWSNWWCFGQQVDGSEAPAAAGATAADGSMLDGGVQRRLPSPAASSLATGSVRLGL